jgi:hypothetical protein
VNCAQDSAGQRYGPAGPKLGHASLTGAFSEAAVLFLRATPAGQQDLARLENTHRQGQALTVLAHTLARAVYDRLTRDTVFALQQFLNGSGSGAGAPTASLDHHGRSLRVVLCHPWFAASLTAEEHRGAFARIPWPLIGRPLRLFGRRRESHPVDGCCPAPDPGTHGRTDTCSHAFAEDGTRAPRGF